MPKFITAKNFIFAFLAKFYGICSVEEMFVE